MMVGNGVIVLVDSLETEIIDNALFATRFWKILFDFTKCRDAPFYSLFQGHVQAVKIYLLSLGQQS